nr:MAG: polyprotein P2a [Sobemovirus sp.]
MLGLAATLVIQASLLWLLLQDPSAKMAVRGLSSAMMGTALILGWQLLCVLRVWLATYLEKEPEAPEDFWVDLNGPPKFDPTRGVYGEAMIDGKVHRIVIQPDYWPLLKSPIKIDSNEAAVANSVVSKVAPGKEPGSLVCIQAKDGKTLGMASRVHCGSQTVLITSAHVLKAGRIADIYLAKYSAASKEGKRLLMDPTWPAEYVSCDKEVDIVAIQVPARYWSLLGVTAAKVKAPSVKTPVLAFGGTSSSGLFSSQGFASPNGGFSIIHSCATQPGWSGTPLYTGSDIVGVHRRWNDIGVSNIATNLIPFHSPCESSENGERGAHAIDEEEWESRDGVPNDVMIAGRGRFKTLEDEYSYRDEHPLAYERLKKSKGQVTWFDMMDEEMDWDIRAETITEVEIPLNCQEAVSACSPPSSQCQESSGAVEKSSAPPECPSLTVENRMLNLEKLLEHQLTNSASLQNQIFTLSQTLAGLLGVRKQNELVFFSKPDDSAQQKNQTTSTERAESSKGNTPDQNSEPASGETLGKPKASKRKSKKSLKGTSSGTPAQESPSA